MNHVKPLEKAMIPRICEFKEPACQKKTTPGCCINHAKPLEKATILHVLALLNRHLSEKTKRDLLVNLRPT